MEAHALDIQTALGSSCVKRSKRVRHADLPVHKWAHLMCVVFASNRTNNNGAMR